jgi:hypothetical protein
MLSLDARIGPGHILRIILLVVSGGLYYFIIQHVYDYPCSCTVLPTLGRLPPPATTAVLAHEPWQMTPRSL